MRSVCLFVLSLATQAELTAGAGWGGKKVIKKFGGGAPKPKAKAVVNKFSCQHPGGKGAATTAEPFGAAGPGKGLYYLENFGSPFESLVASTRRTILDLVNLPMATDARTNGKDQAPHLSLIDMQVNPKYADYVWNYLKNPRNNWEWKELQDLAGKIEFTGEADLAMVGPKALALELKMKDENQITKFRTRFYQLLEAVMTTECAHRGKTYNICQNGEWSTEHVVFACGEDDPWFAVKKLWFGKGVFRPHSTILPVAFFKKMATDTKNAANPKAWHNTFGSDKVRAILAHHTNTDSVGLTEKSVEMLKDELTRISKTKAWGGWFELNMNRSLDPHHENPRTGKKEVTGAMLSLSSNAGPLEFHLPK
mmetsp:Transcript_28697/g.72669  ORF Transcript_28697/g.72669 Transcript_28697/m.72669 type:complete len:366 (-) Transcript_28697:193-1290(-)